MVSIVPFSFFMMRNIVPASGWHTSRSRQGKVRLTERAALFGKVGEVDAEHDTDAVGASNSRDVALGIAAVGIGGALSEGNLGQGCKIDDSRGVVRNDQGVTEFLHVQCARDVLASTARVVRVLDSKVRRHP